MKEAGERFTGATSVPSGASKMLIRILHGLAVLLALLSIVLLDRALAQSPPNTEAEEIATFDSRFSALTDALTAPSQPQPKQAPIVEPRHPSAQPPKETQPFALETEPVKEGDVLGKWDDLNADVRMENETLVRCRTDVVHCPTAAKKFLDVIADGRAHDGRARIGVVNRDINLAIRPTSDLAQWGVMDRWSAPLATLTSGRGDCEDYAIAKYVALREAGVPKYDVRFVIMRDLSSSIDHAVLVARVDDKWLLLDNRRLALTEDKTIARSILPLFVFDESGVKRFMTSFAQAPRFSATAARATPSEVVR
jgi:predicted transglutaminase-like cysteine proteinase